MLRIGKKAITSTLAWYEDQPFSAQPIELASFIYGSLLGNHEQSEKVCRRGLVASPEHWGLNVDLTYALASLNRLDEARDQLARIRTLEGSEARAAVIAANGGLIAYRAGEIEPGRQFYKEAVDVAVGLVDRRTCASALINWAREERRVSIQGSEVLFQYADKVLKALSDQTWAGDIKQMLTIARGVEPAAALVKPAKVPELTVAFPEL